MVRDARGRRARPYDLVLLGNDAADTGDFQVGIRLAYELGRPVVNGVATRRGRRRPRSSARGDGPDGHGDLRGAAARPSSPSWRAASSRATRRVPGRMKAKKVADRGARARAPSRRARAGCGSRCRRRSPSQVQILGEGPEAAPAVVDLLEKLGVLRDDPGPGRDRRRRASIEVSLETLTFARALSAAGGGVPSTRSWSATSADGAASTSWRRTASRTVHHADRRRRSTSYAGAAWAAAVVRPSASGRRRSW